MAHYDDGSIYDDGTKYVGTTITPTEYVAENEVHCHRLSVRLDYTAVIIPGSDESFRIHSLRPRVAPDSQQSFTHEAFVDGTTPSERLSCLVHYTGFVTDFQIYNIQVIAQTKKHQPKG